MTEKNDICNPVGRPSPLKLRAIIASGWVVSGYFLSQVLRLSGNLIMARLLAPEAFGLMAIAVTLQAIVSLCADTGLRQAIIQSPNGDKPLFLNTAWAVEIVRSALIWACCVLVAAALYVAASLGYVRAGSVYSDPVLPAVFAVTSFSAVIQGLQSMNAIVANRMLALKRLTLLELIAQSAGLVATAILGWLTRSVWAFVFGGLFAMTVSTVLTHIWLPGPTSRFEWDRKALHELLHFGKWIWLSSLVGVLAASSDRLLLGSWVDATVLGYYSIALGLAAVLDGLASRVFAGISLPALSEVARSRPHDVPRLVFRMRWLADPAFIGLAGFLFAAGQAIIDILYDHRYAPAGWMLQFLSFSLLFTRYSLAQNCYLALGRSDYGSALSIAKLVAILTIVPTGFYLFGLQGAILGIAFHMALPMLLVFWLNRRHGLNNFRLEIAALMMWPVGYIIGCGVEPVVRAIKSLI